MSKMPADDLKEFRLTSDPVLEHARAEQANAYLPAIDPANRPEFEDLGELPSGYHEIFLVARDPHWLFTYWDLDYASLPAGRRLGLQVFCDDKLETTVDLNEEARNWYVPVQKADTTYRVTLGHRAPDGQWHELLTSRPTKTPPETVSTNWDSQFATVPFHLSFNLLMDVVDAAKASGAPLAEALGELQRATLRMPGVTSDGRIDQLKVLESLLGKEALDRLFSLSSGPLSSGEVAQYLRKELENRLDSGVAGPLSSHGRLAELLAAGGSGELSSGALAGSSQWSGGSSAPLGEELSSGSLSSGGAFASWLQAVLGSLGSESSASLSSFGSLFSGLELASSEAVASWQHALLGGGASEAFGSAFLGSRFGGVSSESAAVWSGLEFGLSSWGQLSSEASLSSGFGSGGFASSWGEGPGAAERGFFMHVNAEVIFYGGTDPRAKVYVNGEPIALSSDGTFRYHFKFPDREFEVPIVAISPDGVESRSATLSFRRSTERRGSVGATAQPPELDEPGS